ncbi:hypothetical protein GF339_12310 [candidate division KSB3 bacterium]|uniref:HAD family hydrolase n=1 Tax=candidate division KSB3 bacterium TaxID=2044937 RepID=A0A9D5Q607_9BACT|nr:hypothetical protein [candidate division KSB3 bacterium]MBD3325364.1 hypothetical protein [candidate division KSB3 bacterium]
MAKTMVITDFDGVVCDSIYECMVSSYNAYGQFHLPNYTRIRRLEDLEPEKQQQFRALRPLIRGGEDYVLIFWVIDQQIPIANQQEFDGLRERYQDRLRQYKQQFYVERDFLLQHDPDQWLRLNPLFDGIEAALKTNDAYRRLHILTTKRQTDVLEILRFYGIDMPPEQITYTKAADKVSHLLRILQEHDADVQASAFIEDQIEFLIESQPHQIQTYLVGWSYITDTQRTLAQQYGIPIIDVAKFTALVQGMQP